MTLSKEQSEKIQHVFFPHSMSCMETVKKTGTRFVYYTSAAVAASILQKREIWMRNTSTMNDFMEVAYGFDCLKQSLKPQNAGAALVNALDLCHPGLSKKIVAHFDGWWPEIRQNTYVTCVSEHSKDEDQNGRLSMWRAYGGHAGVALVFNADVIFSESDALGIYSNPVAYMTPDQFNEQFALIADRIQKEQSFIKKLPPDTVRNVVFNMMRFAVLCTKHPGFHEEREWRVVCSPAMHPSNLQHLSVEVVRGIPQIVVKFNLEDKPEEGLIGLALPALLNRIIIGPCESPFVIQSAFMRLLTEAGVAEPGKKIAVSQIPLRHLK